MSWNPQSYLAFADHRTRPAIDLLARVPLRDAQRVVDLGCGPGNSTHLLVDRWPAAMVIGIDSSSDMLASARRSGIAATWVEADIATWAPDRAPDLIYSNAALHWVGDHEPCCPDCSAVCGLAACWRCRCRATSRRLARAAARDR